MEQVEQHAQVDTGIVGTISAIYDCYVVGNLNAAGSSSYRSTNSRFNYALSTDFNSPNVVTKIGWQTVGHQTGGSGGNEINVVPKLLDTRSWVFYRSECKYNWYYSNKIRNRCLQ